MANSNNSNNPLQPQTNSLEMSSSQPQDILRQQLMEGLLTRLQSAINHQPLNMDFLEFLTRHQLILFESFSDQMGGVSEIIEALQNLHDLVVNEMTLSASMVFEHETEVAPGSGHPRIIIEREKLKSLLDTHLPVTCIAKILCVSRRTLYRRMQEFGLSVRGSYSRMTDQELDDIISTIKSQMPNAGYRLVQGHLVSMGIRVQWSRMMASMHRVDAVGIFSRITQLGCVVRRSYSVRGPLSLVHIDTNHKLIRYNIIFGGVDGYSRKAPELLGVGGVRRWFKLRVKVRRLSSDSLDQSSLEDSLNNTRKLSAPGESSTPPRSSERLAAKRHGLKAESLETLYFTPVNTRHRNTTDYNQDPASSVKRRRTTQVINITLTKKTPGCSEADETYYSLAPARSQTNLSSTHTAQPVSTELFKTPARVPGTEADQLIGLPGYRRSTLHSQTASTFCVGAENEPEGGPEDWIRIAEIQARNKACLPHLKSTYPVEFYNVRNSALIFTDEELRTGDSSETIRRASMMPSQLQDSLASYRCLRRARSILKDSSHPAHRLFSLLPSGRRFRSLRTRTSRLKNSFFPRAVSLLNSNPC